jgi:hypothetical protein
MRAETILRQVIADETVQVHRARLNAVNDAVVALLEGGKVKLSSLGRAIARTSHKHGIKRIDRLLGNAALASELAMFYAAITNRLLGATQRPVVLVDWTETGRSMCTLAAAVPVQGRAVVIHAVTVPMSKWTSRKVEDAFLDHLKALLGPHRVPILISDAGFRAPWMRRIKSLGWDFVTRVRGHARNPVARPFHSS